MTSGRDRTVPGVSTPSRSPDDARKGDDAGRLESLFRAHAARVYAYARRHSCVDAADDIVSETFLVAWRRRDELPDDPLPWLLVVARNLLANQRRSGARADRVWLAAVREQWHLDTAAAPDDAVIERDRHLEALEACSRPEREALLLVAWDGLAVSDAAAVAGCSTRAFTVRLSRARARMRARLEADVPRPSTGAAEPTPAARLAEPTRLTIAKELS